MTCSRHGPNIYMLAYLHVQLPTQLPISVCRKVSNPWHRPPPPICIDLSTFQFIQPHSTSIIASKQAQIGENEAIHTLLIKFYSTRFKISFQGSNISLKDITSGGAMLEMLSRKPITPASFDSVMEKFTKSAFKMGPYLLEMSSDPGLQNTKTELDGIEIRRIGRQITHLTSVWGDEFFYSTVAMNTRVIHDDYTLRGRKGTA